MPEENTDLITPLTLGMREYRRAPRDNHRDIISNLPDEIAHHIMSFMPTKDVVKTACLSKRWQSIWWAYPIHDFDESRYNHPEVMVNRMKLVMAMIETLHRGQVNPTVQKLRICATHPMDGVLQAYAKEYIEIGINESKLTDLDLKFEAMYIYEDSEYYPTFFVFPNMALSSGHYLTSLKLQACHLGPCENFSLPSLKKIILIYVSIDDKTLQLLISNSPILRVLVIRLCFDVKVVRVLNPSLATLIVESAEDLSLLELDAPKLLVFRYNGPYSVEIEENTSEIQEFKSPKRTHGFKELKTVRFSNLRFSDETATRMFSLFKNVESVKFLCCEFQAMPLITNAKLKHLAISFCELGTLMVKNQSLHTYNVSSNTPNINNLRSVSLGGTIEFLDGQFDFKTQPFLEKLLLESCPDLKHLKLSSNTLKKLVVVNCDNLETISVVAQTVEVFKYMGIVVHISTMIVSEEVCVNLNLLQPNTNTERYSHDLWTFLHHFQFAKDLTIQSDHAKFIIVPRDLNNGPAFRFLRKLDVTTVLGRKFKILKNIMELLSISFCLETVIIKTWTCEIDVELKFNVAENTSYMMKHMLNVENTRQKHDCVRHHLDKVKFENFKGNAAEMEVIAYLLRTATILRSVRIHFKLGLTSLNAMAIAETIKGFPIASHVLHTFEYILSST